MARRKTRRSFQNTPRGTRLASGVALGTSGGTVVAGGQNVAYIRPELQNILPTYVIIEDCIAGSRAIKAKREKYLPQPNEEDQSDENSARYEGYLHRAVFYNVVFRTVHALVGQIFLRDPQLDVPDSLQPIVLDANGEGVTLDQTAKLASLHTLSIGRCALHVDFSTAPAGITAQQLASGDHRPVIYEYSGHEVRNWRKARRGSRMVYTLIVVEEEYTIQDDGFENKTAMQYKVMRLLPAGDVQTTLSASLAPDVYASDYQFAVDQAVSAASDVYMIEVWRSDNPSQQHASFGIADSYYPKDAQGQFLHEIPFKFVGSEQNDDSIDNPPMAGMAEINIAHYRNSADYEESVFLVGQPTPYVSGISQEWNKDVLKGQIQLGSRGVIPLPAGGTAGLLQAQPNTLAQGAMDKKERQMVALGAKLVEQREVQRTATEAEMESTADTSILANIAGNVSSAVEWALKTACLFTGDDPDKVSYVLNKEFDLTKMPADARQQLLLEYEADMISFAEMRSNLRRAGIATLPDDEAQTAIDKQKADKQAAALETAKAINLKPVDPDTPLPPSPGSTGNSPGNTPKPKV